MCYLWVDRRPWNMAEASAWVHVSYSLSPLTCPRLEAAQEDAPCPLVTAHCLQKLDQPDEVFQKKMMHAWWNGKRRLHQRGLAASLAGLMEVLHQQLWGSWGPESSKNPTNLFLFKRHVVGSNLAILREGFGQWLGDIMPFGQDKSWASLSSGRTSWGQRPFYF